MINDKIQYRNLTSTTIILKINNELVSIEPDKEFKISVKAEEIYENGLKVIRRDWTVKHTIDQDKIKIKKKLPQIPNTIFIVSSRHLSFFRHRKDVFTMNEPQKNYITNTKYFLGLIK